MVLSVTARRAALAFRQNASRAPATAFRTQQRNMSLSRPARGGGHDEFTAVPHRGYQDHGAQGQGWGWWAFMATSFGSGGACTVVSLLISLIGGGLARRELLVCNGRGKKCSAYPRMTDPRP